MVVVFTRSRPARCVLLAVSIGAFAQRASSQLLSNVNGVLTLGFIAATGALFTEGVPRAVWSRLAYADWSSSLQAAPTLLQLHVYSEIVPVLCETLRGDRARVRRAIVLGSLALLALQLAWSSLGIALVAPSLGGGGLRSDPVDALLGGGHGGAVALATAATAACAVTTTILGTSRALHSFALDAMRPHRREQEPPTDGEQLDGDRSASPVASPSRHRALLLYAATILVPTLIAMTAGSTAAFFGAIDLAGAYPVALLWGLTPPLMALRRRSRKVDAAAPASSYPPRGLLLVLASLSAAFVATNLCGDLAWLVSGVGKARWQ